MQYGGFFSQPFLQTNHFPSSPRKLDPLSSSSSESLPSSIHGSKRKKKTSRQRRKRQRGKPLVFGHHVDWMSLASHHHAREKFLGSPSHDGGIKPTYGNQVGKNHRTNGHHVRTDSFFENPTLKWNKRFSLKECYTQVIMPLFIHCTILYFIFWIMQFFDVCVLMW